jgi:hypothetical protein
MNPFDMNCVKKDSVEIKTTTDNHTTGNTKNKSIISTTTISTNNNNTIANQQKTWQHPNEITTNTNTTENKKPTISNTTNMDKENSIKALSTSFHPNLLKQKKEVNKNNKIPITITKKT